MKMYGKAGEVVGRISVEADKMECSWLLRY